MSAGPRRGRRVSIFILIAGAIVLTSVVAAGCSDQGSAQQLNENAPVAIAMRQTAIQLQNRASGPVTDIKLSVVAYGNAEFSRTIARLDKAENKDVNLSELTSRDGTTFNARLSKPKLVRVSAIDADGNRHDLETPWR
jgi:hypothetical protein